MTAAAIDITQPAADQTRTELTLSRLGRQWSTEPSGWRFTEALIDFLRARDNPHTLRSYSYSILELFSWFERDKGRIPTPAQIRRAEAVEYEKWLRTRDHGLTEWRLRNDPSRELDLAIYRAVKRHAGIRISELRRELLRDAAHVTWVNVEREQGGYDRVKVLKVDAVGKGGLAKRLGCLVEVKTLLRTPSIDQIRRGQVEVGLPIEQARRVGLGVRVPHEVFQYYVPSDQSQAAQRASTICARLTALASFWSYLQHTGENVGSDEPLIKLNIWSEPLAAAARQAPSHQMATRAAKTPSLTLFERLVATTFVGSYGSDAALQMAACQMRPTEVAEPKRVRSKETFADIRDRAMMLLLGQTGVRAEELSSLVRGSVSGDPPMIDVVGKGGRRRRLRVPPATQAALLALERKLRRMADHQARYGSGRSRAQALLGRSAPLLPSICQWGKNAGHSDVSGLTRQGIAMMLRRRAIAAGVDPLSAEFAQVHPHGMRHLFAHVAIAAKTPINVVQAIMGHQSGAQTLRYMEEHRPDMLIAAGWSAPASEAGARAAPGAPVRAAEPAELAVRRPSEQRAEQPVRAAVEPPPEPMEPIRQAPVFEPVMISRIAARPLAPVALQAPVEGLVALGEAPEEPPDRITLAEHETLDRLAAIYDDRWGERGNRARIGRTTLPVSEEIEHLRLEGELEAILGFESAPSRVEHGAERLVHTYVGKHSGLIWWAGSMGRLAPEMPVMSPAQAGDCSADAKSAVCAGLVALWRSWAAGKGKGATAASALVSWIAEALEVSAQVSQEITDRGGRWVAWDADWDETSDPAKPRLVFREHDPEEIVGWFEQRAWEYRTATTRKKKVAGETLQAPGYYALEDPIAGLDEGERAELIDWIAALSGQQPTDQRSRFDGASRAEVARFVSQMCLYDTQRDLVGQIRAEVREGEASEIEQRAAERSAEHAASEVNRTAIMLGARQQEPFDIVAEVKERVRRRRGHEKVREPRQDFYLRVVARIFGAEAANDDIIRLVALCGHTPLASDKDLFHIDRVRRTITHDPEFARAFASRTGTHSECVARRLARDLWELRKEHLSGKRVRVLERPDELLDAVETMAAFKVPCPSAQEHELARRLGSREPMPIYEQWRKSAGAMPSAQAAKRREIEGELAEFGEQYAEEIGAEFARGIFENRAKPNPMTHAARAAMPGVPQLLAAVLVR